MCLHEIRPERDRYACNDQWNGNETDSLYDLLHCSFLSLPIYELREVRTVKKELV